MKTIIAILVVIIVAIGAGVLYLNYHTPPAVTVNNNGAATTTEPVATTTPAAEAQGATVIGKSVNGKDITAYHYGTGSTELLFVGGRLLAGLFFG